MRPAQLRPNSLPSSSSSSSANVVATAGRRYQRRPTAPGSPIQSFHRRSYAAATAPQRTGVTGPAESTTAATTIAVETTEETSTAIPTLSPTTTTISATSTAISNDEDDLTTSTTTPTQPTTEVPPAIVTTTQQSLLTPAASAAPTVTDAAAVDADGKVHVAKGPAERAASASTARDDDKPSAALAVQSRRPQRISGFYATAAGRLGRRAEAAAIARAIPTQMPLPSLRAVR